MVTVAKAVVEVVKVIVEVVVEVVTTIVEVVVKAVKAVVQFLGDMVKAVTDLLMSIVAWILRQAIGCDPITPARNMLAATADAVKDKLVEWTKGYVLPTLEEGNQNLERDPYEEEFERHMDKMKVYEDKKGECVKKFSKKALKKIKKEKAECIASKGPSLERLEQELERSVDMERGDKDKEYGEWFKATAECRVQYNIAFRTP